MKKTNVIILGLIVLISLGITANLLFGSDESDGLVEEVELASQTKQVERDRQLNEKDKNVDKNDDILDEEATEKQAPHQEESDTDDVDSDSNLKGTKESNNNSNKDNSDEKNSSESLKEMPRSEQQEPTASEENNYESSENEQLIEENTDKNISDQDSTNEDYPEETITEVVSLIIDARSDGGDSYLGEVTYDQGDTALAALLKFASQRGISVKLDEGNNSGDILEIDGHTNKEDGGQWILYIDGYRAVNKAGANKIAPNTTVRYHYMMNAE